MHDTDVYALPVAIVAISSRPQCQKFIDEIFK